MGNCLRQPGQLLNRLVKLCEQLHHHLSNFVYRDNSCCRDKVNRAAGRRSAVMIFAAPLRQFYRDMTTRSRLPGFSHLENFTVKRKFSYVYQDCAKTMSAADTDGNLYHRAVMCKDIDP
jgi:hypothetical protein